MQDQATKLRRLASRIASVEGGQKRARQIVLSGGKGGVGTTTLAISLAICLRKFASRILLVDANPNRGDIASMCRLHGLRDIDDVVAGRDLITHVAVTGPAGIQVVPRFRLPSTAPTASSRQVVRGLDSVSHAFDFIVVDAGSCSLTAETLWQVADQAIVVADTDTVAVMDAYALIKSIAGHVPTDLACIMNRFEDSRLVEDMAGRLVHSCRHFLGVELCLLGSVPADHHIPRALADGRMAVCAAPDSPSAVALLEIARQLASAESVDVVSISTEADAQINEGPKLNSKLCRFDSICEEDVPIHG